tara:strand:+ start:734 stop:1663 length:930 start_codon:yes stop_codon:yes gene_type:complete
MMPGLPVLWSRPIVLLTLSTIFWGGNAVAGRFAVGHISPFLLTHLRWFILAMFLLVLFRKRLQEAKELFCAGWIGFVLGGIALGGFNMFFYIAAHHTTAINLGILQGSIPIFVIAGSFLFFKDRIGPLQSVGILIGLTGVLVLASGGQLMRLVGIEFNIGDLYMLIGCGLFSAYILGLRKQSNGDEIIGLLLFSITAQIVTVFGVAYELNTGELFWPSVEGWLIVFFVTVFPSFLAHLFYIRSVQLIGVGICGLFFNLVPISASLMAVTLLSEKFGVFHAVSLILVVLGLWLAQKPTLDGAGRNHSSSS